MVTINTKRFGDMEIDEQSVINIIGGLIGFPGQENFVIIRHQENTPFYWLQSVDDPELALVMVDPHLFKADYDPPVPLSLNKELEVESPDDVNVFVIVTIPSGSPQDMTANLLGPLAVNPKSKKGKQLVLDDRHYSHKYPVLAK